MKREQTNKRRRRKKLFIRTGEIKFERPGTPSREDAKRNENSQVPESIEPAEARRPVSPGASGESERASRATRRTERDADPALLCARRVWRALDARRSQTAAAYRSCRRCYLRDTTRRPLLRGVRAHVLTLEFRASRIFKAKAEDFIPVSLLPRQRRALSVYTFYEWESQVER